MIARRTAVKIVEVLEDNTMSADHADAIVGMLLLIPGSKSYRDSIQLVRDVLKERNDAKDPLNEE